MSRQALKNREERRHKLAEKYAAFRSQLRAVLKSKENSMQEKMEASGKLSKLPRDSSLSRQSNRCKICDRPRGVFHKRFQLCRLCLRHLARLGRLPGLRKSSW